MATAPVRAAVVATMQAELGVREATGRNDGPRVREYQRAAGVPAGGEWCAAFVCWVLERAGSPFQRNGWAAAWFPARRVIWRRSGFRGQRPPQPGDVIGYAFSRTKPDHINHVGLILRWGTGNSVATVEGNTNAAGSRTGSGVYQKWRLKSQVYAVSDWITPPAR